MQEPVSARGLAVGDYDDDGDLDLLVIGDRRPAVVVAQRHAAARATGSRCGPLNRHGSPALNARVTVTTGRRRGKCGSCAAGRRTSRRMPWNCTSGWAQATAIDSLKIVWPGGTREGAVRDESGSDGDRARTAIGAGGEREQERRVFRSILIVLVLVLESSALAIGENEHREFEYEKDRILAFCPSREAATSEPVWVTPLGLLVAITLTQSASEGRVTLAGIFDVALFDAASARIGIGKNGETPHNDRIIGISPAEEGASPWSWSPIRYRVSRGGSGRWD